MSVQPQDLPPATQDQLDLMRATMVATIAILGSGSLYRVIHCTYTLVQVIRYKVCDKFAIALPVSIGIWSLNSFVFLLFVYQSFQGIEWSTLALNAVFAGLFGIGMIFKWVQAFQYIEVAVAIPSVFTSIQIDDYLKVKEKD